MAHSVPPPPVPDVIVSFPSAHVVLITLNRPGQLNAIPSTHHAAFDALYRWYDAEPSLRCAVVTGAGRAFCAGADLKEWDQRGSTQGGRQQAPSEDRWAGVSFGGLSNRAGKKPVIAAVNGLCLGGGMEMIINCDLVVAADSAKFGLPEVTRGVVPLAGALPRVIRTLGRQRAAEMVLTGRQFSAAEMESWGLVNRVVPRADLVAEAVKLAEVIAGNSPDAVVVSREGLRLGWEGIGPDLATEVLQKGLYARIDGGDNVKEGLRSFVEKRKPVWKNSKL